MARQAGDAAVDEYKAAMPPAGPGLRLDPLEEKVSLLFPALPDFTFLDPTQDGSFLKDPPSPSPQPPSVD